MVTAVLVSEGASVAIGVDVGLGGMVVGTAVTQPATEMASRGRRSARRVSCLISS
jgi:hypothetical protein